MRYVLDTHALLWYLGGDKRLGPNAKGILDDPNALLIVPALVLAEAKHAADRKRVSIPFERVLQAVVSAARITIFPLDLYIINYLSIQLDIHDSIMVATALHCQEFFGDDVPILTNDLAITQAHLVSVIW